MAKNKPPAFQFYPADWLSSSHRILMSLAAQGAYINLLAFAWTSDPIATLPNEPTVLWKLAQATPAEWDEIKDSVLDNFVVFDEDPSRLVNKRLRQVWLTLLEHSETQSARGKKGAEGRWSAKPKPSAPAEDKAATEAEDETSPAPEESGSGVDIDEEAV